MSLFDPLYRPCASHIEAAARRLRPVVLHTPLLEHRRLSERYGARIALKREDQQVVRSFKIRGAHNKISALTALQQRRGVVCASAGNHSQGLAYSCALLEIKGTIFMPLSTPPQKIAQTQYYGGRWIQLVVGGDTFEEAQGAASAFQRSQQCTLVHAFDDAAVIEGQATIAVELLEDSSEAIDLVVVPLGGGGLAAGVSSYLAQRSPATQVIAAEPAGAAAMKISLDAGCNTTLEHIDTFSDGAAVKRVGELGFAICRQNLAQVVAVPEGRICSEILRLYNSDAIVAEPAGALSVAALDSIAPLIRGKRVVCVLSGGNNDIGRIEDIRARSLHYEGFDVCAGLPLSV